MSIRLRRLRMPLVAVALLGCAAALLPIAGARLRADKPAPPPPASAAVSVAVQPIYVVHAGIDGEIFPAFANYASLQKPRNRKLATISVRVLNSTRRMLKNRIKVEVPGWSDPEIQMIEVAPGESRSFAFAPTFFPRLYSAREIAPASAAVVATDPAGRVVYSATVPVRLRPAEDMYWGARFRYAPFIAAWVTPHDPRVEQVLSRAKEYTPGRRLPGYEPWKNTAGQVHSTYQQARAIYRALHKLGVSYVKSSTTFGRHLDVSQRVRFPGESLQRISANCIDGAVMYASLFENLGMDPSVILVPGHAYVAVREAQHSDSYLYIETSLTGRASFASAVLSANRGLGMFRADQIIRIPIEQSRRQGIYPMPLPSRPNQARAQAAAPVHAPARLSR